MSATNFCSEYNLNFISYNNYVIINIIIDIKIELKIITIYSCGNRKQE